MLRTHYPTIAELYETTHATLLAGLRASDRLRARPVLAIWERWLELVMGRREREFALPYGVTIYMVRAELRSLRLRVSWVRSREGGLRCRIYPAARATWL